MPGQMWGNNSGSSATDGALVLPLTTAPTAAPTLSAINITPAGTIMRVQPVQEFDLDRADVTLAGTEPTTDEVPAAQENAIAVITYPVDVDEDTNQQVYTFVGGTWQSVSIDTIPNRYEITLPLASSVEELSWLRVINYVGADGSSGCSETNVIRINVPDSLQGELAGAAGQYVDITTYGESNTLQVVDGEWMHRPSADLPLINFDTTDPQQGQ